MSSSVIRHWTSASLLAAAAWTGSCGGGGGGASPVEEPTGPGSVVGASGDLALAGHVLRRTTFGATPELLDELVGQGTGAWLNRQLDPQSIPLDESPRLLALRALIPEPASELDTPTQGQLVGWRLAHALYSPRQLEEQLVDFWESHFNTFWFRVQPFTGSNTTTNWFEWRESELFRAHALGSFHQLLIDSATSPAMLIMLDNVMNVAWNPNENYARELLELHTLGVDHGYTQADVVELARCFTGWGLCQVAPGSIDDPLAPCGGAPGDRWAFHFDAALHDGGAKRLFAGKKYQLDLPARAGADGLQDGFDVLAHLAGMSLCAEFVSTKLVQRFVSDDAPADLVAECVKRWKATDGSIREVLVVIFNSPYFHDGSRFWTKVPTPLESLATTIRAFDGELSTLGQLTRLQEWLDGTLNQKLFRWDTPDGYPEAGEKQLGTAKVLERVRFNATLALGDALDPTWDLRAWLVAHAIALDDPAAIVDAYVRVLFQGAIDAEARDAAIQFLATDDTGAVAPLDPAASDWDGRVRLTAAFVASLPEALQQ
ncbi:MAG: DUF1800 domain-containing protein [Planctomycetes bacterium]|nr:DUF1800 domain-containing protein [Planctomycetota bacterium]